MLGPQAVDVRPCRFLILRILWAHDCVRAVGASGGGGCKVVLLNCYFRAHHKPPYSLLTREQWLASVLDVSPAISPVQDSGSDGSQGRMQCGGSYVARLVFRALLEARAGRSPQGVGGSCDQVRMQVGVLQEMHELSQMAGGHEGEHTARRRLARSQAHHGGDQQAKQGP